MSCLSCLAVLYLYLIVVAAIERPPQPPLNKIDLHHHTSPDFFNIIARDVGLVDAGLPQPVWSVNTSLEIMQNKGIRVAVLQAPTPGALALNGTASHALARQLNDYSASIREGYPNRFGFFGTLPNLLDTEAALAEIAYSLDVLHADGISIFNRYRPLAASASADDVYLGHPSLEPIWAELNRRRAVVILHPIFFSEPWRPVDPLFVQPTFDWPHDTARSVLDMLQSGTRTKYPNCSVILPHAGGTLLYLFGRAVNIVAAGNPSANAREQAAKDLKSFHFDTAGQETEQMIRFLLDMVPHDHITFGTDYPYAPSSGMGRTALDNYTMSAGLRAKIYHKNAEALFPKFAQ